MARFLFATQPITGHVLPALPIVSALVRHGHEAVWYAGGKFRPEIEATGARFASYQRAYDFDDNDYDAAFPGRQGLSGLAQLRFDLINLFMTPIQPQVEDLRAILRDFPADVTVGDASVVAPFAINETGGPPNAVYNMSCLGIKGRDVAPFGTALPPNSSALGRVRNAALYSLGAHVIFRAVSAELERQCRRVGMRPRPFEGHVASPYLFLQPSVAGFEYPRTDLPPQVHFIGPLLPEPTGHPILPPWWSRVTSSRQPVVVVTQGTVATDPRELIAPTLQALAREEVLVIAAGVKEPEALGNPVPENACAAAFIPFAQLLPHADVFVTNGGFGGVTRALASGIPIVVSGTTEDKPEIGNRIAYHGLGINLKMVAPPPERIRSAVRALLREPHYRARARALQEEMAAHDAPEEAAALLAQLARTRQPVYAPSPSAPLTPRARTA